MGQQSLDLWFLVTSKAKDRAKVKDYTHKAKDFQNVLKDRPRTNITAVQDVRDSNPYSGVLN